MRAIKLICPFEYKNIYTLFMIVLQGYHTLSIRKNLIARSRVFFRILIYDFRSSGYRQRVVSRGSLTSLSQLALYSQPVLTRNRSHAIQHKWNRVSNATSLAGFPCVHLDNITCRIVLLLIACLKASVLPYVNRRVAGPFLAS